MGDKIISEGVTILAAIVGLATIAVLVSKQANTSSVLTSGGTAFSSILKAAVSPISGSGGLSL